MKHLKKSLMIFCMLISSVAFSQVYGDFDTNRDGKVSTDEFNRSYANQFNEWDSDRDGKISDKEFYDASYNNLDIDGDGNLSRAEWDKGYENMNGFYLGSNDYMKWDTNRDSRLSNDEFRTGFRDNDEFYTSYDRNDDGTVNRGELNEGIFKNMDRNRDGNLDEKEFETGRTGHMNAATRARNNSRAR